jgi:hypothetical protein
MADTYLYLFRSNITASDYLETLEIIEGTDLVKDFLNNVYSYVETLEEEFLTKRDKVERIYFVKLELVDTVRPLNVFWRKEDAVFNTLIDKEKTFIMVAAKECTTTMIPEEFINWDTGVAIRELRNNLTLFSLVPDTRLPVIPIEQYEKVLGQFKYGKFGWR